MTAGLPRQARSQRYDRLTPAQSARLHAASLAILERTSCMTLGPDGLFLEAQHTIDHYREHWYPTLIDRLSRPAWLARGGATLGERAATRVDTILAKHQVAPLPEAAELAITEILERAARTPRAEPIP